MGCINRAAILTGPGAVVGNSGQIPTPEQILAQWEKISSLKAAKEYQSVTEQIGDLLAAFSQPTATAESGQGFAAVSEVFDAMPGAFVAEAGAGVDVVFQYNISGDGGGDWYSIIQDGNCRVDAGTHEKAGCTLKMSAADFLDLMNGKLPAMQAYTSGKLKIEGDIMKSQLIEKLFKFNF
jgi:putative sterol carrier protein